MACKARPWYDPSIDEKIEILRLMESLGIETANIGLPGAGPRAYADAEALAREIVQSRLKIRPNCAARTHRKRYPSHRRNLPAHRHRHRSRHVSRLQPHPPHG